MLTKGRIFILNQTLFSRHRRLNDVIDAFMKAATEEAKKGVGEGGIPTGSILVKDGKIIGRRHNKRVQGDPIMHAEIDGLRNAGRIGKTAEIVLYSALMPCNRWAGQLSSLELRKSL